MTEYAISSEHLERLPLFPLPRMVFFPDTLLPLHVFEPRYRAMAEHCIANECPLAVVLIDPGHEREQLGNPPIASIAGVGRLVHHERLSDGRVNIVLNGLERVRLAEVSTDAPYRVAGATVLRDTWPDAEIQLRADEASLRSCLTALRFRWVEAPHGLMDWLLQSPNGAVLSNRVGSALLSDPAEQQKILETCDVQARLRMTLERVITLLSEQSEADQILH